MRLCRAARSARLPGGPLAPFVDGLGIAPEIFFGPELRLVGEIGAHQGNGFWETPSVEAGRAYLAHELRRLVADLDTRLEKLRRPSVAGLVFYVSGPLHVENIGHTVAAEGILYPMNPAEKDILQSLAGALRV